MKGLINYLELKVIEYKRECKSLEVVEAENALEEAKKSKVIIDNLVCEMSGGEKYCNHNFQCSCAFNAAKDILK